jgi:quinoprotein glucose dehydrogenase
MSAASTPGLRASPSRSVFSAIPTWAISRVAAAAACALAGLALAQSPGASDWGSWGGDAAGRRYSSLNQIDRGNVANLQVAWEYHTGELGAGFARADQLAFAATPVLAFGLLYLSTPTNIIIALDPITGRERWRFDPHIARERPYAEATSRGVAAWQDLDSKRTGPCVQRIFEGTLDARLLAVDAATGRPCADFGTNGSVELLAGPRARSAGDVSVTSPPALYRDIVIVGSASPDPLARGTERGVVRAVDARTGALRWSFDPLPARPDHPATADWEPAQAAAVGGGNAAAAMSVDTDRGIVFVATGSASADYYGGSRSGSNRLANSLLAIDATTGTLLWDRQLVHHDLWNYDLASQPTLADLEINNASWAAVIQASKSGMIYVFDRETGAPVFPIVERPVPRSLVPGENAWPTQPFSALGALVAQQPITADDAWGLSFWDRGRCRRRIAQLRNDGPFTPPDRRGTLLAPGAAGGVGWGGVAFDPQRQRVFAAVNHLPFVVTLLDRAEWDRQVRAKGEHGDYERSEFIRQAGTPYGARREPLLSPWNLPCTAPPWGTLVSLDLKTGHVAWQVPLGSTEGFLPAWLPVRDFGMPNMGGPIVTAGNLVFVAAAADPYLRAFDVETGRELWKHRLPAGGQSTPMTYLAGADGRQFVVIAAGGDAALGTLRGDSVVAFALPGAARAAGAR